jgi:hypothetical protein
MAAFWKSISSKVSSFSQRFKNKGKPLIFQGELFKTLHRSSVSSNVNTILLSSLSSVVRDFKNCHAWRILFFMVDLEIGLLEMIFPIRVREGGRGWLEGEGPTKMGMERSE